MESSRWSINVEPRPIQKLLSCVKDLFRKASTLQTFPNHKFRSDEREIQEREINTKAKQIKLEFIFLIARKALLQHISLFLRFFSIRESMNAGLKWIFSASMPYRFSLLLLHLIQDEI